jgi:hypothetical protein
MLENKEIWKDINGYSGYQISNLGRVWSIKSQRYLKGGINHGGYYSVQMTANNGKIKREYIHRLVALHFIPNPYNKPQVNHKDENKENNCADNLEWITHAENQNYGTKNKRVSENHADYKMGNHPQAKAVECIELQKIFSCAKEASKELNIDNSDIGKACKGRLKTAGGYHWRYVGGD